MAKKKTQLQRAFDKAERKLYAKTKIPKAAKKYELLKAFYKSPQWRYMQEKAFDENGKLCNSCGTNDPELYYETVHNIDPIFYPEHANDVKHVMILCHDCSVAFSSHKASRVDYSMFSISGEPSTYADWRVTSVGKRLSIIRNTPKPKVSKVSKPVVRKIKLHHPDQ